MTNLVGAVTGLAVLVGAGCARAEIEYSYADVLEARPIIQVVDVSVPSQLCRQEELLVERNYPGRTSSTPVILATIIGGALGNAVGHDKSNQRVGAVVGAVLGHSIGRDIIARQQGAPVREVELVEVCETLYETHAEERIMGYQVTYLYNGREYQTRTASDPGERIRVRVQVEPVL